jgi:syntaxin 16
LKSQTQVAAQDVLEPDFRMRDRELTDIAKSIAELAELFKDLSAMVIDQGTLLDSIEYNIEQTTIEVSQAVKELEVATRCVLDVTITSTDAYNSSTYSYQKNTGRRSCIFLLLLVIFGLVVVLVFKPRRHPPPTISPPSSEEPLEQNPDALGAPLRRWTLRRRPPYLL